MGFDFLVDIAAALATVAYIITLVIPKIKLPIVRSVSVRAIY